MTQTILRNDLIKGALIAYLKTLTTVTNKLVAYGSSASEIREGQWKSDEFVYPNIRVRIIRNVPEDGDCDKASISASILVHTEDQSSATCDELSGIIATYFKGEQFSVNFSGSDYHISLGRVTLIPAISLGATVWRSEVVIEGYLSLM